MRPIVIQWLERLVPPEVAGTIAPSWFTCVGLAGVVTLFLMIAIARRNRIDPGVIASVVLWCYLCAVAAGIIVPMLIDAVQQHVTTGIVHLHWAGMTSFWGYLAGIAAVAVVCADHGLPISRFGDLAAAPMGVALALARLGCFLGGCDYGKVTSVPWAVRFPAGSPAWSDQVAAGLLPADRAESLAVHPTQLYEALLGVVIVGVALMVARMPWARQRQGRVFLAAAATYATGRIIVETFRGDMGRGIYFGLSSGQIFSILVLGAIAVIALIQRPRAASMIVALAGIALVDASTAEAQPAPQPRQQAETGTDAGPRFELGVLVGFAAPLNRRMNQVAMLAGPSLSLGLALDKLAAWLDYDSYANTDASHGTLLVSGGAMTELGRLKLGFRIGVGGTLVNFKEPAFRDVVGSTFRFEAVGEYDVGEAWTLWFRPMSFDVLTAADLGGPITTYQMRAGVAYRFGAHRRQAAPPPAPANPSPPATSPYPPAPPGPPILPPGPPILPSGLSAPSPNTPRSP